MAKLSLLHGLTIAIGVIGTTLSIGGGAWLHASRADESLRDFARLGDRVESEVQRRMTMPLYGLNGLKGLHAASVTVDRDEFRAWVQARDMDGEFPGVRGFGRIERVPRAELEPWLAEVRRDGAPGFEIRRLQPGEHDTAYVIRYVEPMGRNATAVGLDVGSEPRRREAIEQAIATGAPVLTAPILVVQDGRPSPGFLLYMPLYRAGAPVGSAEERQRALHGVLYAPIVASELFAGAAGAAAQLVDFELHAVVPEAGEELVFDNDGHLSGVAAGQPLTASTGGAYAGRRYLAERRLNLHGRTFALRVSSTPAFEQTTDRATPWLVAIGGLALTAALAWASAVSARARRRAERLAASMTLELDRLAAVARHTSNAVVITGIDGRTTWVNEAFERITGYTRAEALGRTPGSLLQCEATDRREVARLCAALNAAQPFHGELVNRTKDGRDYWIELEIQPLHDSAGSLTGFMAVESDITEKKQAARQLATQRRRLEGIIAGTQAGTWEHHLDTGEYRINDLYASMLGYTHEECSALVAQGFKTLVHPEDLPEVERRSNQHLHGLTREFVAEYRMRHKEGHWVWVQSRGTVSRRSETGEPLATAGIHLDITERKTAEHALAHSRERLAQIIEGTNVGTWEWNVETGQTVFNERWAEICGYTLAEFGSTTIQTWTDLAHPEDLSRSSMLLERHFNGQTAGYECEARMRHKDGHWVWVLDRGKLFSRSADGRPRWMAGTHMDITERKQAEAALRHSQTLLDRTALLSHTGGWVVELEPLAVRWTDQTCRIHDREPGHQPTLDEGLAYYAPEARPVIESAVRRCIDSGEGFDLELPLVTARSRAIWVRTIGEAEHDNGRVVRLVGAFQDITDRRRLTQALQEQHTLLQTVLESLPCGVSAFDGQRRLMLANSEIGRLLDIPEAMLSDPSTGFDDLVRLNAERGEYGPVEGEALEAAVRQRIAMVEDPIVPHQFERVRPDGTVLDARGAPLPGGGWVTTYTDITARRRAEQEARQSSELLRNAIEAIDEAFVLFDPQDRLVLCNQRYRDVYPECAEMIEPGNRFEDIIRFGAERGQYPVAVGRIDEWVAERMALHRSGDRVHLQRQSDGRVLRIIERHLPDGHIVGFRVDVTALEQARQQADEARARLQAIYDILPVGITISDPQGHIIDCNPASERLLGITRAEHLARSHDGADGEILREDGTPMPPEELASVRALTERRAVQDAVMQVVTPQRSVWLSVSAMPADHPGLGVVVGYVDITEQRAHQAALQEAKAAAEQASVAKSQFLANMSHEIRTPMNAILGMLTLLRRTELTARQNDYAAKTEGAARSLLGLLNDILDFSKVEAGKMVLDPHPFRIDQLLRDLAVILAANVGVKPLEVLFDLDPGVPAWLHGDALRLQQVLINLAGNAIKFTERGEVVVGVRVLDADANGAHLRFEVRDTGIGIAPENQARIFSGFTQAEASTTRRFGGTGLGVAISQRLVALMGGRIGLQSTLGQGSCFSFELRLPRAEGRGEPAARPPSMPMRALVVDDHPTAREILRRQCESLHWEVDVAQDGTEAVERNRAAGAAGRPYDVLLMDWTMPGEDGFETLARIRPDGPGASPTAVVMVTAHSREHLETLGAPQRELIDAYLVKPVTPSMLLDAVIDIRVGNDLDRAVAPRRAQHNTAARRLAGLRLLLVEDNVNNQQVACELLRDEGAEVEVAGNGAVAVEAVAAADPPFDLVLMDLQMPVMDGYTATTRIRQDLGLTALPIVAMTANAMASDRHACLAAGMNEHVGKPFDLDELVQVITRLTGTRATPVPAPSGPVQAPVPASSASGELDAPSVPAPVRALAASVDMELDAALRRMGGKAGVLRRLLAGFPDDARRLHAQAVHAAGEGRAEERGRALHTLKGLAATLGLRRLADAAASAERATEWRAEHATDLDTELARVQQAVPAMLQAWPDLPPGVTLPPPSPEVDAGALRRDLHALHRLLADSDMAALDAVQSIAARHTAQARLGALTDAVQALDFDTAARQAKTWIEELQTCP